MDYIEISVQVNEDFAEILIAELAEIGFDSFIETEDGIQGYVLEPELDTQAVKELMETYAERTAISYSLKKIEKQNWNAEWENSFDPITVANRIIVRASFHEPQPAFEHEIIITPKMSFGTGHHETTAQIMELQLGIDHQGKEVLDVGTGTGILAILSAKLGASTVRAFDIDEWSVENTKENIELNACPEISVGLGTIADESPKTYDIVIANINRNILLAEIPTYADFLKAGGTLMLSGFYVKDIPEIQHLAEQHGLKKAHHISKKDWAAVVFKKE